jgi:hypothetical protein
VLVVGQETVQRIELAVGCILFGLLVIRFSQKRRISFRYTVGWLVLCGLGIFASLLIPVFTPIAEFLKLSPTVFLIAVASVGSALLFLQLTVSISGTQRRVDSLAQENALLREKLERFESSAQR